MSLLQPPMRDLGPALVRTVAIAAFALGASVWAAVLFAPAARDLPPVLDAGAAPLHDTAPVARWFGGAALRVRVAVVGLISGSDGQGAALLSIDGAPARAWRVGDTLAPGVVLRAVGPAGVSVEQDGVIEDVALPVPAAPRGFLPAASETGGR